jgi:hypothetical protein
MYTKRVAKDMQMESMVITERGGCMAARKLEVASVGSEQF